MAKLFSSFSVFMLLLILILINGLMFSSVEGRRHKYGHAKIDCSSDKFCDPFSPRIDLGCKDSGNCQERCNQFGGVFLCSDEHGYCKCAMETQLLNR
ncbi:hypothetical protein SOVF_001780 [Spinacia oleracea]|nr:hypothetical protein SOVF_001780 [Spinacia oleracea]